MKNVDIEKEGYSTMKFHPNVFIVKNEYHIVVITKKQSQVYLKIGRKTYYEENGGIVPSLDIVHKIVVPQKVLDKTGKYTVCIRQTIEKKPYYPIFGDEKKVEYLFKTERFDGLKGYYLADTHSAYDKAKKLASYQKDSEFLIYNGDFGETNSVNDIMKLNKFFSDVTKGNIPVLFVRGNHDTRGKISETLYRYVGMDGQKGYFTFSFRSIAGLALDCGEDKPDTNKEYGGCANCFTPYRKEEAKFIQKAKLDGKYKLAVCHTSFMRLESMRGQFDIERNTYAKWAKALNEKGLHGMLTGHIHKIAFWKANSEDSVQPHNYPVISGSQVLRLPDGQREMCGTAMRFEDGKIRLTVTDERQAVVAEYIFE